jgi:hypothetical protein
LTRHQDERDEDNYEEIKEPFDIILEWIKNGGVQDVPDVDVVFPLAMLLASGMEKEVKKIFRTLSNPNNACHKWHNMA